MALHINDLIAKGMEESDVEQDANDFIDDTLGDSAASMVDTLLILGQLDPLEVGPDGKQRWTPEQQKLIMEANTKVGEYLN